MCDYSLAGIPNRLAAEGEHLVVYRFSTGARGLTPPTASPALGWPGRFCPSLPAQELASRIMKSDWRPPK
jgi:hypothetical protein